MTGALRSRTERGACIAVLSGALGHGIQIIATVILARLLTRADFGIVAMAATLSILRVNFGLNEFTEAVIQGKEIDHTLASSMFWINLGLSLLLTIRFASAGSFVAWFCGESRVAHLAIGMSVPILISSTSVQHLAIPKRALRYSVLCANDIVARAFAVAVSVLLDWEGLS